MITIVHTATLYLRVDFLNASKNLNASTGPFLGMIAQLSTNLVIMTGTIMILLRKRSGQILQDLIILISIWIVLGLGLLIIF